MLLFVRAMVLTRNMDLTSPSTIYESYPGWLYNVSFLDGNSKCSYVDHIFLQTVIRGPSVRVALHLDNRKGTECKLYPGLILFHSNISSN